MEEGDFNQLLISIASAKKIQSDFHEEIHENDQQIESRMTNEETKTKKMKRKHEVILNELKKLPQEKTEHSFTIGGITLNPTVLSPSPLRPPSPPLDASPTSHRFPVMNLSSSTSRVSRMPKYPHCLDISALKEGVDLSSLISSDPKDFYSHFTRVTKPTNKGQSRLRCLTCNHEFEKSGQKKPLQHLLGYNPHAFDGIRVVKSCPKPFMPLILNLQKVYPPSNPIELNHGIPPTYSSATPPPPPASSLLLPSFAPSSPETPNSTLEIIKKHEEEPAVKKRIIESQLPSEQKKEKSLTLNTLSNFCFPFYSQNIVSENPLGDHQMNLSFPSYIPSVRSPPTVDSFCQSTASLQQAFRLENHIKVLHFLQQYNLPLTVIDDRNIQEFIKIIGITSCDYIPSSTMMLKDFTSIVLTCNSTHCLSI